MTAVLQSFSRIGASATGLPNLNPQTVLSIGGGMAETLFDSPASASFLPSFELAIVESVSAFFVLLSFVIAAAALMLALIESYLVVGGTALLLGFAGSRWTASFAEGYFSYVVKLGTRLLFFYLVLGIGVQLATQWQAALTAACNPVATTLPWYSTYGAPPKAIMATVCSNAIPIRTMLDLAALSIVFLIVTLAVPYTAAGIVGGTVGLALNHAFEAAYIAQTVVRPISSALHSSLSKIPQIGRFSAESASEVNNWLNTMPSARSTQRLTNTNPDTMQRVPQFNNTRSTSVIPQRAPDTTSMDSSSAALPKVNGGTSVGAPTGRI